MDWSNSLTPHLFIWFLASSWGKKLCFGVRVMPHDSQSLGGSSLELVPRFCLYKVASRSKAKFDYHTISSGQVPKVCYVRVSMKTSTNITTRQISKLWQRKNFLWIIAPWSTTKLKRSTFTCRNLWLLYWFKYLYLSHQFTIHNARSKCFVTLSTCLL